MVYFRHWGWLIKWMDTDQRIYSCLVKFILDKKIIIGKISNSVHMRSLKYDYHNGTKKYKI